MNTWFTSDLHFDHKNIIEFCDRPFTKDNWGVSYMNEKIVSNYNSLVGVDDECYFLGDIAFQLGGGSLKHVKRMNGTKYLVPGNHDKCWKPKDLNNKFKGMYEEAGFIVLDEQVQLEEFLLCHFPFTGDHTYDDRYIQYRPKDEGQWLIHGHVHDTWLQRGKAINVGIDAWGGFPVSIETIRSMVRDGPNDLDIIKWD